MANNNPRQTSAGTNANEVRRRNQQAAQGQQNQQPQNQGQQFSTEFASETNAQEVRRRNQQSQQNKK